LPLNERGHLLTMSTLTMTSIDSLRKEIEATGITDARPDSFYQELMDYGIESAEQFQDAYQGDYQDGASFAERLCEDCGYLNESDVPSFILNHIDWEGVWTRELRFDYFEVEIGVQGSAFFSNNF